MSQVVIKRVWRKPLMSWFLKVTLLPFIMVATYVAVPFSVVLATFHATIRGIDAY